MAGKMISSSHLLRSIRSTEFPARLLSWRFSRLTVVASVLAVIKNLAEIFGQQFVAALFAVYETRHAVL